MAKEWKSVAGKNGILGYKLLLRLLAEGGVEGANKEAAGPSSLDLHPSREIYEVGAVYLPERGREIKQAFQEQGLIKAKLKTAALRPGKIYLVRLQERLRLPPWLRAVASPKSSIGRIDIHVRLLNNRQERLDSFGYGYQGNLWALLISHSFRVKLAPSEPITQLRFMVGDPRLRDYRQLQDFFAKGEYIFSRRRGRAKNFAGLRFTDYDNGVLLTVDLAAPIVAWRAKKRAPLLDLGGGMGQYRHQDFFTPIRRSDLKEGLLLLRPSEFYILSIAQRLRLPLDWSVEFLPIDTYSGEFRGHYAGFVDPGWGLGTPAGRQLTLELRTFEKLLLHHHQPIIKIAWDKLVAATELGYDSRRHSHYRDQVGPRLAKFFK